MNANSKYDFLVPAVRVALESGGEFRHYLTPTEAKKDADRIVAAIGGRLRNVVDRKIRIRRYEHILVIRRQA